MPPIILKASRLKYLGLLTLSLGFVALGVLLLRKDQPGAVWAGWGNIVFFGAGSVLFVWQIVDARPRVVIDAFGVFDRTLGVGVIPWADIVDARLLFIRSIPFVCLELRDPDRWRLQLGLIRRALTRGNEALGGTILNVNLSGVQADPHEVLAVIHAGIRKQKEAPRAIRG
jgi:hypothetical protein